MLKACRSKWEYKQNRKQYIDIPEHICVLVHLRVHIHMRLTTHLRPPQTCVSIQMCAPKHICISPHEYTEEPIYAHRNKQKHTGATRDIHNFRQHHAPSTQTQTQPEAPEVTSQDLKGILRGGLLAGAFGGKHPKTHAHIHTICNQMCTAEHKCTQRQQKADRGNQRHSEH